jgi:predicted DNA-binding transcriptional regulator AlpA
MSGQEHRRHPLANLDDVYAFGELLTDAQLCGLLQVDARTTLRWRNVGDGPPFVRVGTRRVMYRKADIEAWIATRTFPHRAAEAVAGQGTAA